MSIKPSLKRHIPILEWLPRYRTQTLLYDGTAALVVTLLLIPQALAYAMLAGMPPETGLYAALLPLVAYAVFGTSQTLAVGPFAVVSMMTASAVGGVVAQTDADYLTAAVALAAVSGGMLVGMGLLRLGFLANFLSHPVISGFISASGILIGASQLEHLLGIPTQGQTLLEIGGAIWESREAFHELTLAVGLSTLLFLILLRHCLKRAMLALGCPKLLADVAAKAGPFIAVACATMVSAAYQLEERGVNVVGVIPSTLPAVAVPTISSDLLAALWIPALLISIVGFAESVSMAQSLASKRRERIDPDQELIGLGAANLASAFSGAFPVSASLSRTVVNSDAGALTPAAGLITAGGIAMATLFLTTLLHELPLAVLAATIILAVTSLVDVRGFRTIWRYSRTDGATLAATFVLTLMLGVTLGLLVGVSLSLVLYLYRTSRPHSALVGRIPGSEHFRNIARYQVETVPHLAILRIDESLYFANARFLEGVVVRVVASNPELHHLVLLCPAVNHIDASAIESLETILERLENAGIALHLAEVKGPVMDKLRDTSFIENLTGRVFLSAYEAWRLLCPGPRER